MVTEELALRIEQSEIDHITSWMRFLRDLGGNPFNIAVRELGNSVALMDSTASLGPLLNRVLGFDSSSLPHMQALMRLYDDRQVGCRFDINPYRGSANVYRALADSKLVPFRFHSALYLQANSSEVQTLAPPVPSNLHVEHVTHDQEDVWASTWLNGFTEALGLAPGIGALLAGRTAQLYKIPGWTLYLARVDGQPAAAAALYVQDGVATPCLAGTTPGFRGQGCQTALLRTRLADAVEQNCDLIAAQSALGSTSQNNMERAGMRVAYTRAFWWKPYQA